MDRVSNRRSRSSSVVYKLSHLPDETYNVSTSVWLPLSREFQKRRFRSVLHFHKEVGLRDCHGSNFCLARVTPDAMVLARFPMVWAPRPTHCYTDPPQA